MEKNMRRARMPGWFKRKYIVRISIVIVLLGIAAFYAHMLAGTLPPASQGINCGTLDVPFDVPKNFEKNEIHSKGLCFWHAYQHCTTATLTVNQTGIDDGLRSVFIAQQEQGSCVLTDSVQEESPYPHGLLFYHTFTCSALILSENVLNFNDCGQLHVSLPL
jgi:hypothetical protein